MGSSNSIAYACLDIGTSQVKLGLYLPGKTNVISLVGNSPNRLITGSFGKVHASYDESREISFSLLKSLGTILKYEQVSEVHLGICGHVSSLLEWDTSSGMPCTDTFPIWMDTTCAEALAEYEHIMGDGKSRDIIGTFMPAGTNWLLAKLINRSREGFIKGNKFLQVSDGIFYELTSSYATHFSSPISMVDLRKRQYAEPLLAHLGLEASSLPVITAGPLPMKRDVASGLGWNIPCLVYPAMADLYASLHGLKLEDGEGFMLANTSEQAGAFYMQRPQPLKNFLSISFDPGFVNYGSTNTGGNVINWLMGSILKREVNGSELDEMTGRASRLSPDETPLVLPYLQGERAPLWNSGLTASILELNASHTDAHLFLAALESVAFARRQCFEELGMDGMDMIKFAGGSSQNKFWNLLRASVINKPLAIAHEKELAIAGVINYMMDQDKTGEEKPELGFHILAPDPLLHAAYETKYRKFIHYQKLLQ